MTIYAVMTAAPLVAMLVLSPKLAPRALLALVITTAATLAASIGAYVLIVHDPSFIALVMGFFLFVLPAVITPVAGATASLIVKCRRDLPLSLLGAFLGCAIGQILVITLALIGVASAAGDGAITVACPVAYGSSVAVLVNALQRELS
jgi:hypothetical protein